MDTKELQKLSENICTSLSQMQEKKEVYNFLRDLLSEKEIIEFSRRFEVAGMLEKNISYKKIEEKTGMSSTTIARISKFFKGENKGYKNALSVLKNSDTIQDNPLSPTGSSPYFKGSESKALSAKHHEGHYS